MSSGNSAGLVQKYRKRGLLVDTNLLLHFFVGDLNPELIASFKRTKASGFTIDDFELLKNLMRRFERIVTTPNILTEVSNLSKWSDAVRQEYFERFGRLIIKFDERHTASSSFCLENYFFEFGLTDAAIIHSAKDKYLVLTTDFKLSGYLHENKIDVINFNHLRQMNWNEFSFPN